MLVPLLFGALAVVLLVAAGVAFFRARAREESAAGQDALAADGLTEMRALGQRIETLVGQQQLQGETARQHLAQKLDAVGEGIDQQRTHLAGLQNELRHEVHRRDAEMDEIRTQLATIQHATVLGAAPAPLGLPPATPALASAAPALASAAPDEPPPVAAEPADASVPDVQALPAFQAGDGLPSFGEPPFADGWDTGATGAPALPETRPDEARPDEARPDEARPDEAQPAPAADPFAFVNPFASSEAPTDATDDTPTLAPDSDFEPFDFQPFDFAPLGDDSTDEADDSFDSFFEDVSFADVPGLAFQQLTPLPAPAPAPAAPVPATLPPAPPSDSAWVARADRTAGVPTPAAPVLVPTPDGADDLTAITTIDETVQSALYAAGVVTLDEIARWSRADARRVSGLVSVPEETIVNQWIFEAQAALFQSFSTRK